MSSWEIMAASLGVIYVILAAKESLWTWVFGFFSTLIYTILFWEGALVSSSLLNFYYMLMAIYGFYAWRKGSEGDELNISTLSFLKNLQFIGVGIVLSIVIGYLSNTYTDARLAYMDAFVLTFSVLATWMLTQKILENWLYWLVIDSVAIVLYWNTGYLATVILFVIYIILGIYAYVTWRKEFRPVNIKPYKLFENKEIKKFSLLKEQGHCNINYYLETEKQNYLIRTFKHQRERKTEFYIQNLVYKKNIAAKALLLDETNNLMICDYIEGKHLFKLNQKNIRSLALSLKKLHSIKIQQRPNDLKRIFKYKDKKVYEAFKILSKFKPEYVLGHNDLHPKNILFGDKIKFIDWEYAGKTDKYFDLAAIIIEFKFNKQEEKYFLRSYFPHQKAPNHKKLKAFKVIYTTLWTVWFGNLERGQIELV